MQFIRSEVVLLVRGDSPWKTPPDFIAAAKAASGAGAPLNYATFSNASSFHIYGEALKRGAAIDLVHIPYKGESLQLIDLIGGQVGSSWNSIGTAMPQLKSRRVRALALVGAVRSKVMPEVPTFAELGVPRPDTNAFPRQRKAASPASYTSPGTGSGPPRAHRKTGCSYSTRRSTRR